VINVLSQDPPERVPAPAIDAIERLRGQSISAAVDGNRPPRQPRCAERPFGIQVSAS